MILPKKVGKPNSDGGKLTYTGKKFFIIGLQYYSSSDGYKWKNSAYTLPVDPPGIDRIEYTKEKGFVVIVGDVYTEATFTLLSKMIHSHQIKRMFMHN